MKRFSFQIPKALVHLREGVVTPTNNGLKKAILDLVQGRISQVTSIFYFSDDDDYSFFYIYKRVLESYYLSKKFEQYNFDMKLSLNFSGDSIYSQMMKSDSSIFYTTPELPEIDLEYSKIINEKLSSFDIVEVKGIYSYPESIITPYWKYKQNLKLEINTIDYEKINLFFHNPLHFSNEEELFDVSCNLYSYLGQ
jgi:hypothetical protein